MELEAYDAARDAVARGGLGPRTQTKISLFVCTAKQTNLWFLSAAALPPFTTAAHQFLHAQYFHELESLSLLVRITRWMPDPSLPIRAAAITAPIWSEWALVPPVPGWALAPQTFYRGLAIGHALLAGVRLTPVIPANADPLDPFVVALRRIEQDNARMLQTQIRLLKSAVPEVALVERERIIEEKQQAVERSFADLLGWLSETTEA